MPRDSTRVLPTPPGYTAGYVLLDARKDRPLRAWAEHLEFWEDGGGVTTPCKAGAARGVIGHRGALTAPVASPNSDRPRWLSSST